MAKDNKQKSFEDQINELDDESRNKLKMATIGLSNTDGFKSLLTLFEYLNKELQKPVYEGKSYLQLYEEAEKDEDGEPVKDSLCMQAWNNAEEAAGEILRPDPGEQREATIKEQQAGRDRRRQLKEAAEEQGAIMTLHNGTLPVFSKKDLWDAFAPGRISKIGKLSLNEIDNQTGRIRKTEFEEGEIIPLSAMDISYTTFMLLNAILANSVENCRQDFIENGAITFYVKGVLNSIGIDDTRAWKKAQDKKLQVDTSTQRLDRKTTEVLYLESQFEPFLKYIGTTSNGSRYSVLNYVGYNADTDTMTIRTPYLYTLWQATQHEYSLRQKRKEEREAINKKPFKKDLIPMEVNLFFKGPAYKENDTVLEIAAYITNVMLNAGKSKKDSVKVTEINYKTLIAHCSRLQEKLDEINARPRKERLPDGSIRNNNAIYNSELRKIETAFNLIRNPDKCTVLEHYEIISFEPALTGKNNEMIFEAPTKRKLDGKMTITWRSKE